MGCCKSAENADQNDIKTEIISKQQKNYTEFNPELESRLNWSNMQVTSRSNSEISLVNLPDVSNEISLTSWGNI